MEVSQYIEKAISEERPKKLLIANLAFGPLFTKIFTEYHLKCLLIPDAIPSYKDRIAFLMFTDEETKPSLEENPNWLAIKNLVPAEIIVLGNKKLEGRMCYAALQQAFKEAIKFSLRINSYLSFFVADSFLAKDGLCKIFEKVDAGYDAILSSPMRMAFEPASHYFDVMSHNLSSMELFNIAYKFMHPLWVACHWEAAQFSLRPFSLLWNTGGGLFNRSFSVSPLVLTPSKEMLNVTTVMDAEVGSLCKNPFWAINWIDAPIVGIDPLSEFYPPFCQKKASTGLVGFWAKKSIHPSQFAYLEHEFCYPCKEILPTSGKEERDKIVKEILENAKR